MGTAGARGSGRQAASSMARHWELRAGQALPRGNVGLLFQASWFLRGAINPSDIVTFPNIHTIFVYLCSSQQHICQLELAHWPPFCHFWALKQGRAMVTRAEVYGISQHEKDSVTGCGWQVVAGPGREVPALAPW